MSATLREARSEILGLFKPAWEAGPFTSDKPIFYWNARPGEPPAGEDASQNPLGYVNVRVTLLPSFLSALPGEGGGHYTRPGLFVAEIFTPFGTGSVEPDEIAQGVLDMFEGKRTTNVWFRDAHPEFVGKDGEFFKTNVTVQFQFDQIK